MSYSIDNIVNVTTLLSAAGLGFANFGKACLFVAGDTPITPPPAPPAETEDTAKLTLKGSVGAVKTPVASTYATTKSSKAIGSHAVYNSISEMAEDGYTSTSEAYKIASRWFGNSPAGKQLTVYIRDPQKTVVDSLNEARDRLWWYWTFFTKEVYDSVTEPFDQVAAWGDAAGAMVPYFPSVAEWQKAKNGITGTATAVMASGTRHTFVFGNDKDQYAGAGLCAWFANVNYLLDNSTITGEYKPLPGVTADELTGTQITNLRNLGAVFYSGIELQGSSVAGRTIDTKTASAFGEWIDDVVNTDAFINAIKVSLFNTITGSPTKLAQTMAGQATLIASARQVCEQYVANGFLGERTWTNPDSGLEETVSGYQILSKPEDILTISSAERAARKAAPIKIRAFRAGAIHAIDVTVEVF